MATLTPEQWKQLEALKNSGVTEEQLRESARQLSLGGTPTGSLWGIGSPVYNASTGKYETKGDVEGFVWHGDGPAPDMTKEEILRDMGALSKMPEGGVSGNPPNGSLIDFLQAIAGSQGNVPQGNAVAQNMNTGGSVMPQPGGAGYTSHYGLPPAQKGLLPGPVQSQPMSVLPAANANDPGLATNGPPVGSTYMDMIKARFG